MSKGSIDLTFLLAKLSIRITLYRYRPRKDMVIEKKIHDEFEGHLIEEIFELLYEIKNLLEKVTKRF